MDYILFSSIRGTDLRDITISYDISCQYDKKIWQRHNRLPRSLQLDPQLINVSFAIPKFHLPAHQSRCHSVYSLNFRRGAGRTDGEGIERDWSLTNEVSNSTKEMLAGHRSDTIDDTCGFINYMRSLAMSRYVFPSCLSLA